MGSHVFLLNLGTIFQYKMSRNVHFLPWSKHQSWKYVSFIFSTHLGGGGKEEDPKAECEPGPGWGECSGPGEEELGLELTEFETLLQARAWNKPLLSFELYNHLEDPYYGLLLVESCYYDFQPVEGLAGPFP